MSKRRDVFHGSRMGGNTLRRFGCTHFSVLSQCTGTCSHSQVIHMANPKTAMRSHNQPSYHPTAQLVWLSCASGIQKLFYGNTLPWKNKACLQTRHQEKVVIRTQEAGYCNCRFQPLQHLKPNHVGPGWPLVLNSMKNQSSRLIFPCCSQQLKLECDAQCTIQWLWVHFQVQDIASIKSVGQKSVGLCGIAVYLVGREPAFNLLKRTENNMKRRASATLRFIYPVCVRNCGDNVWC